MADKGSSRAVISLADKVQISAMDKAADNELIREANHAANNEPHSVVKKRPTRHAHSLPNREVNLHELKRRVVMFPSSDSGTAERNSSDAQCDGVVVKGATIRDFAGFQILDTTQNTKATKPFDPYHATVSLMKLYRTASWSIRNRAERIIECDEEEYNQGVRTVLLHLAEFAPTYLKQEFEERVTELFKSVWLLEIIDSAMIKLRTYPYHGKHYYDALFYKYIDDTIYHENDCSFSRNLSVLNTTKRNVKGCVLSRIIWPLIVMEANAAVSHSEM